MDGGVAVAIVVILGFVIFIAWAKSATGRMTLHNSLGSSHSFRKRVRAAKHRPASPARRSTKTTKKPPVKK